MDDHPADRHGVLLSDEARTLYRELIDSRVPPSVDACAEAGLRQLLDLGLAQVEGERVVAVAPSQGQSNLASVLHTRTRQMLDELTEISDFLDSCTTSLAAVYTSSDGAGAEKVRVITDHAEMSQFSARLPGLAQRSYLSVQTSHRIVERKGHQMVGPVAQAESDSGVRSRVIVDPRMAHDEQASAIFAAGLKRGEQVRCHPAPPLKFMLVDGAVALIPLDESASAGAVVLESPAIGTLLAWTFEHLWQEAEPLSHAPTTAIDLEPTELRILRMMADDATDAAMSEALGISDRSLRRHVSSLAATLGVHSRHGSVAAGFRRGLLP